MTVLAVVASFMHARFQRALWHLAVGFDNRLKLRNIPLKATAGRPRESHQAEGDVRALC